MSEQLQIHGEQIIIADDLAWQKYYADAIEELYPSQTVEQIEAAMRERNIRFYETRQQTVDEDQAANKG